MSVALPPGLKTVDIMIGTKLFTYSELYPFSLCKNTWSHGQLLELLWNMHWHKNKRLTLDDVARIKEYVNDQELPRTTIRFKDYLISYEEQRAAWWQVHMNGSEDHEDRLDQTYGENKYEEVFTRVKALEEVFADPALERDLKTIVFAKYWTNLDDKQICQVLQSPLYLDASSENLYSKVPEDFKSSKWIEIPCRVYAWIRRHSHKVYHEITNLEEGEFIGYQTLLLHPLFLPANKFKIMSVDGAKQAARPKNHLSEGLNEPTTIELCLLNAYNKPDDAARWKFVSRMSDGAWNDAFSAMKVRMQEAENTPRLPELVWYSRSNLYED
ncbi:MAG: hypothetical protein Q9220_006967 [cf. Caloplaca sp. 1 TL-2023]